MVLINDRKNKDIKGKRIKLYITGQYYIQVKIFHPKLNLNFFCLLGDKGKLIENQPRLKKIKPQFNFGHQVSEQVNKYPSHDQGYH